MKRRWWIPALLLVVVVAATLALNGNPPTVYRASARVLVDLPSLPAVEGMGFDPRLTAPQATEYLVDDYSEFVRGDVVASSVSRRLADDGIQVPPDVIRSSTASESIHRVVRIDVTWHDPDQAAAILRATLDVLREESPAHFARLAQEEPLITVVDEPDVAPVPPSLTQRLDFPLRVVFALVVGVALCFLLNYLDDGIRGRSELEGMGLKVLGEIPAKRWPRFR